MFSGSDEQLVDCLRTLAESSLCSKGEREICAAAADRIEAMLGALSLWIDYNDSDMSSVSAMLSYEDALAATRAIFETQKD